MVQTRDRTTSSNAPVAILGGVGLIALAVFSRSIGRRPTDGKPGQQPDPRAALTAYLHDHLMGADAAIQVVDRLKRVCAGTPEGRLFASLHQRFIQERRVVEGLLSELGESRGSAKRVGARVAGHALRTIVSRAHDELSRFHALEGLAVGVQGKRCMWRALQAVDPPLRASLEILEADALKQWEEIEVCRLAIAARVFGLR